MFILEHKVLVELVVAVLVEKVVLLFHLHQELQILEEVEAEAKEQVVLVEKV